MIRSQSQEEGQVDFHYEWNSSFGRKIAQSNLERLKLKVNDIIKVQISSLNLNFSRNSSRNPKKFGSLGWGVGIQSLQPSYLIWRAS